MKKAVLLLAVLTLLVISPVSVLAATNNDKSMSGTAGNVYMTIPYNAVQRPVNGITLQISVYYDDWSSLGSVFRKFVSNTQNANSGYALYYNPAGNVSFSFYDGTQFQVVGYPASNLSSGWHTITGTYNGNSQKLFIDGVLVSSREVTGKITYANNSATYLGSEPGPSQFANAILDDFRIWDHGLSDTQVGYVWNRLLRGDETGLVGYYPMDDGTLKDFSSRKINGNIGSFVPSTNTFDLLSVPSILDAPKNLSGKAYDGLTSLTWEEVISDNLLGYDVYVNGVKQNNSPIVGTSYDAVVQNNVTNSFYVVAIPKYGTVSNPSNTVTTMFDTISPLAPVGLAVNGKVTAAGNVDSAVLSWTPSSAPDLDGYNAYLMPSTKLNTSLIKVTSYTVTGLDANVTYEFAVTAVDESGNESPKSNSVFYTFDTIAPDPPTNLKVSDVTASSAKLTFNPSSAPDVMQYRIYANGELVGTIPGNAAAYTVTGLIQNTSYTFEVSAIDEAGNESTRASAAATTPISTIPVLTVASGHQQAELSWTPIAIAVKYYIYRDGVKIAETTDSHYVDNGLENGQEYTYTVSAVDGDGVEYDQSAPEVATPGKHSLDFSGIKVPFSVVGMLQTAKEFLSKYGVWILLALGVLFSAALLDPATKTVDQAAGRGRKKGRKGKTKVAADKKSADKNPKDATAKTIDKLAMTSTAKTSKPKGSGRGKRSREGLIAKQIPAERNGKKYLTTVYVKPENYKQGKVIYMGGSKAK